MYQYIYIDEQVPSNLVQCMRMPISKIPICEFFQTICSLHHCVEYRARMACFSFAFIHYSAALAHEMIQSAPKAYWCKKRDLIRTLTSRESEHLKGSSLLRYRLDLRFILTTSDLRQRQDESGQVVVTYIDCPRAVWCHLKCI
jgi:hypothetical protein